MKRTRKLPELLAPAGSFDALISAIMGGADAVYLGGLKFGARAFAKNFDEEEMARAVRVCHMFGVRIYVTLNTIIFDKEMDEAVEYAKSLHAMGVDALIVADIGLVCKLKREIPELELHASTQMGVHNTAGADFAEKLGCNRVVLARECSYENIERICELSKPECEVFVHGALCVCHSGQCLFSSIVGGRSGNRGECAQPCRLPYKTAAGEGYTLSLRDLSLSNHIEKLIDLGVSSLKIEGRMKSPSYVYEVTRIYRTLLDAHRSATKEENRRLADIFSRSGFTDGYFKGALFGAMTGVRTEDEKTRAKELSDINIMLPRVKIRAKAKFALGEASSLSLSCVVPSRWDALIGKITVTAIGDIPNPAENSPLDRNALAARLSKMGNTPFELPLDAIDIELDDGINLPPSAVNTLRRHASALLEAQYSKTLDALIGLPTPAAGFAHTQDESCEKADKAVNSALIFNTDTASSLLGADRSPLADIDAVFVPLFKYEELSEKERERVNGVYIPPVIMEHEWGKVEETLTHVAKNGVKYALIGNISHLSMARKCGASPFGDFRLNIANRESASFWKGLGLCDFILSPELTVPQARDIIKSAGGSLITLGRIPLMLTERCFIKENFGCNTCKEGKAYLSDRRGMRFPMLREYEHRTLIFNSAPTYMGDKKDELRSAKIRSEHFIISSEAPEEAIALLLAYKKGAALSAPHRRIGKR